MAVPTSSAPPPKRPRFEASALILPSAEIEEARRLRKRGWSIAGLCRRYEIAEDDMRAVLLKPKEWV